jgi:alanine racemase
MRIGVLELSEMLGASIKGNQEARDIVRVITDTRNMGVEAGAVFAAISGVNHDGHKFISQAYSKGVRVFICEHEVDFMGDDDATFLIVPDTLKALQKWALLHRRKFQIPVIAITGSNGKTVVKEWLNQLLAEDYQICRSPRSFNSQLGVALSLLQLEPYHQMAIFEAGISQPGEMDMLQDMIQPEMGVFTFAGTAHAENFLSERQLIGEKLKLFSHCHTIICPQRTEMLELLHEQTHHKRICFKTPTSEALQIRDGKGFIRLVYQDQSLEFEIPFSDKASADNAITCIYLLLHLGYDFSIIQQRLARLSPLEMRLQMLHSANDSIIVNDAYSNDLQSLEIAMDFLISQAGNRRKVVIVSDMIQSGMNALVMCSQMAELLLRKKVDRCIAVGNVLSSHKNFFPPDTVFFDSPESLLLALHPDDFMHCAVLIKGARSYRLERAVALLQEKTHETILEIDMNAVAHNLAVYRSKLAPGVKVMSMVKAFGYGSGIEEMASLLSFNKVNMLAVAYADEGAMLRRAGISLPIMVMHPEAASIGTILKNHLEPEIYSQRVLQLFIDGIAAMNFQGELNIHLKIDTGMHRLGFLPSEVENVARTIAENSIFRIASVFTHLSTSENSLHDDFTHEQVRRFNKANDVIGSYCSYAYDRHVLNTAGIERFPEYQFEMVRCGIGLYGVSPSSSKSGLKSVGRLMTRISQIKEISAGESVGYGRSFFAEKKMRIATVPVGYADGLSRQLSNGKGKMFVSGSMAPIVGKVCMDMTMIDVTEILCSEGDEVEIFGRDISIEDFAKMSDTIPYEVMTSIGQRVRRIYRQE